MNRPFERSDGLYARVVESACKVAYLGKDPAPVRKQPFPAMRPQQDTQRGTQHVRRHFGSLSKESGNRSHISVFWVPFFPKQGTAVSVYAFSLGSFLFNGRDDCSPLSVFFRFLSFSKERNNRSLGSLGSRPPSPCQATEKRFLHRYCGMGRIHHIIQINI